MELGCWGRHAEFYPCSWYFEAPEGIIDSYGLRHGDVVRILLDGTCYLCVTYKRDRPKITVGGCISLIDDSVANEFSGFNEQMSKFSVQRLPSGLIFNPDSDFISIYLPPAFQRGAIKEEAISIIKATLYGAPYTHNTWMNISLAMVKARARISNIKNNDQNVLDDNCGVDSSPPPPPPIVQPKCRWIGCTTIKSMLQYCISSSSVSHFLVSGPRGSGKMTLLKDCLHKFGQFSSLIVSTNDLIEGKLVCTEYTSDSVWYPAGSTVSHRILPQVAEACKQDFFTDYNGFLRVLSIPRHEQADFLLLSKTREMTQGRSNLSSSLIDLISRSSTYDFLIFKEFDSVFVQRSDLASPEQCRLTSTLLMLIDGGTRQPSGFQRQCKYVGIVTDVSKIDAALRRPGRFEETITLTNPSFDLRAQFLQETLLDCNNSVSKTIIDSLTEATASMPLGDIKELLTTCATIDQVQLVKTVQQHIQKFRARNTLELSNEIFSCRVPDPNPLEPFKAISVHDDILKKLSDTILIPIMHRDLFWKLMRSRSSGNILCTGPTGSGKTFLIRRLIRQVFGRVAFFELNCSQVFSLYVGNSEKNIRRAFQEARSNMPSVLILDNYDSLAENRDSGEASGDSVASRVLATLLVELDGLSTGTFGQVTVLAVTSRPDKIDRALIRPGRIDHRIYIGYIPKEVIMGDKMWIEIEQFHNLPLTDVIAMKKGVVDGYNSGLCITIGSIVRQSRLLASKAVSLSEVLDNLKKSMVLLES